MHYLPQFETSTSEKLYDLKQLKEVLGGGSEILTSLAGIYLNTIPVNSREMRQAVEAEDWIKASKIAHKIKPTIDSMNIKSIFTDIRTLEKDAKNQVNTGELANIAVKVDSVINTVAEQLKYEFNL